MGKDTYRKAEAVVQAAKADPEQYGDLPAKMDATGKVDGAFKELQRRQMPQETPEYPISDAYMKALNNIVGFLNGVRKQYGGIQNVISHKEWDPDETPMFGQLVRALRDALDRNLKELEQ